CSPAPRTMGELAKALGKVLRRPSFLPVPAFALDLALGRGRAEVVLSGQRVRPKRLIELGFPFEHPSL
ncbi:DUF1731 domain-containing protein, partial [Vibrio parahaemolyticus]